jgi:hypothetical protein
MYNLERIRGDEGKGVEERRRKELSKEEGREEGAE